MPAFYRCPFRELSNCPDHELTGHLTQAAAKAGFHQQLHDQTSAWLAQLSLLRTCAAELQSQMSIDLSRWQTLWEYPIPRRGKRVDVVLIAESLIFVVEFKIGATTYARFATVQVEDYALDLRDFHLQSRGRDLIPFHVATRAPRQPVPAETSLDLVKPVWLANADDLSSKIHQAWASYQNGELELIDSVLWDQSPYEPTPTIVEAAQALYSGQNVREISRCHAGAENLTQTSSAVLDAIQEAKSHRRKLIAFVTGVPGSGKTLAGLNIVHDPTVASGELGVFLSGNGPLVRVLTEALSRDKAERSQWSRNESRRTVKTFVQNVHHFIDDYYGQPDRIPTDRVIVFDEAQRAWDAAQSMRKFQRPESEPEILMGIMDRHPGWSVIIALIGNGQEINRGEAGLREWGSTLAESYQHWEVHISPRLKTQGDSGNTRCLFEEIPRGLRITEDPRLHLEVSLRSYKAQILSEFVDSMLEPNIRHARSLKSRMQDYPIVMTRELETAREWLRARQRGLRRTGLVASSGARRLRAHGLDVTCDLEIEKWFLNDSADVRSSSYLEVPATEFGIQGLELDWVGLCWGGDLIPDREGWRFQAFRGTKWQNVAQPEMKNYILNKYRVLLTRAREGLVIWVPRGDFRDPTRPDDLMHSIADRLQACGILQI